MRDSIFIIFLAVYFPLMLVWGMLADYRIEPNLRKHLENKYNITINRVHQRRGFAWDIISTPTQDQKNLKRIQAYYTLTIVGIFLIVPLIVLPFGVIFLLDRILPR